MRTVRIYSLDFHVYHIAVLTIIIMHVSLILIHLVTGSLYVLTTFLQFPLPQHSASGNLRSDLIFYGFFCFRFYKYVSSYSVCLSLCDLLHLA